MSRWPDWVTAATEPTDDEIARVDGRLSDDALQALRIATCPTDAEVHRVVAAAMAPQRAGTPGVRGLALGAGLGLVALLAWPLRFGPVDVPAGTVASVDSELSLGSSTTMLGDGSVRVQQVDRSGTRVEVLEGEVLFEVDPEGRYRDVRVTSGDIEVRVMGTRFSVSDQPAVLVERGHVQVFRDGAQIADLQAGERWFEAPAVTPERPPVAVRAARMEPPGWKPRALPRAPVQAVLSLPRPSDQSPVPRPVALRPAPVRPPASSAFAEVLSRGDAGRDAAVLAADWTIFLGRYPDAPEGLRSEARVRRLDARLETLRPEDAVAAIAQFLGQEPEHPRRLELAYARATLLRGDLSDCRRAIPDYRTAATAKGSIGARSEVFLGVCLLHLGDAEGAAAAIERARELGVPEDVERYASRVVRRTGSPR